MAGAYEALGKARKAAWKRLAGIGRLLKQTRECVYIVEDRKNIRECCGGCRSSEEVCEA